MSSPISVACPSQYGFRPARSTVVVMEPNLDIPATPLHAGTTFRGCPVNAFATACQFARPPVRRRRWSGARLIGRAGGCSTRSHAAAPRRVERGGRAEKRLHATGHRPHPELAPAHGHQDPACRHGAKIESLAGALWLSIVHGLQERVYSLSRQVEDARYRRLDSVGTRPPLVSLGVVQEMRVGCCFPVDPRPPSVQHPLQAFPDASKETPASGELSWFKSRLAPVANSQTHPGGRTMTIHRMTLKALIEKGSDDDLLREMVGSVANG